MISAAKEQICRLLAEDARHLPVLTGLRGFAALWVYLYHVWGLSGHQQFLVGTTTMRFDLTPLVSMGGAGVSLFFVLSGFLLSLPFAEWQAGMRERPKTGWYFFRRLMRVFPAYYIQLAILLLIAFAVQGADAIPDVSSLLRHLAMLFVPPPIGVSPFNGVWWTLPIEFSFYLALPFLTIFLKPSRWFILLLTSCTVMWMWRHSVIASLADASIPLIVISSYQLPGSIDMFGFGMLAAVIHVNRASLPACLDRFLRHDAATMLGLLLLTIAIYWLAGNRQQYWANNPIFYLWTPLLSLGTVLVILAGTGGSRLASTLFANRPVVFFGLISYSAYLWHFPLLEWIGVICRDHAANSFATLLLLSLPLLLLVATMSYLAVERPGIRFRSAMRSKLS
jgi:peptidoglycan/LPS O-acetylase OafA/YrhL